jgi:WD40 repeat protein
MSRPLRAASPLNALSGVAIAAFLLASSPPASAGIFGASRSDVAVKVAELPEKSGDLLVSGLDFSPDGSRLAEEWGGSTINIWDWRNRRVEMTLNKPHGGNDLDALNPILFSPDSRFLANCEGSGAGDVVVRIWSTSNWSVVKDIAAGTGIESAGGCNGIVFTPDGQQLARTSKAGGRGNNFIVYMVGTWQPIWGLQIDGFSPKSLAISPNGEQAAIAGTIFVRPPDVKDPVERFQQTKIVATINVVDLKQHKVVRVIPSIYSGPLAWSPDGAQVAIAGGAGVEIFDPQSGEKAVHEDLDKAAHMNVRFTSDGRYFIECDQNGRGTGLGVKIWDAGHHKLMQEISGNVGSIAVSRDGKTLAVGSDGRTTIWQFR